MRAYCFADCVRQGDDARLDLLQGEGLGEEALGARGERLEQPGIAGVGGHHEKWAPGRKVALLHLQQEIEPVHVRHIQVAEDEAERLIGGCGVCQYRQTLHSIGRVQDLGEMGKGEAQRALQDAVHDRGIVQDQDPNRHVARCGHRACIGPAGEGVMGRIQVSRREVMGRVRGGGRILQARDRVRFAMRKVQGP